METTEKKYDAEGYDKYGHDKNGIHKDTGTKYDPDGYDAELTKAFKKQTNKRKGKKMSKLQLQNITANVYRTKKGEIHILKVNDRKRDNCGDKEYDTPIVYTPMADFLTKYYHK